VLYWAHKVYFKKNIDSPITCEQQSAIHFEDILIWKDMTDYKIVFSRDSFAYVHQNDPDAHKRYITRFITDTYFNPVFSGVRVARSLVLCVMFCRSLYVLLSFFF